jgi:DNA-binding CsgD family transcriptional regulator
VRDLTARQKAVLVLSAQGLSDSEIGEAMGLSKHTVKIHLDALRRNLEVDNKRAAPLAYFLLTGECPVCTTRPEDALVQALEAANGDARTPEAR